MPSLTLNGHYQFLILNSAPLNETDVVTMHFAAKDSAVVGLIGGGIKYALSARHGLRVDFRVHVSTHSIDTLVDASPSLVTGIPALSISSNTTPAILFSNTSATRGNLTGPAIVDLKTFTASGRDIQSSFSVGYFIRFSPLATRARVSSPRTRAASAGAGKWELEFHAGGLSGNQPTQGTAISAFPVGDSFTTAFGRASRYASTWYFGDGAVLINQIGTGFAGSPAATTKVTSLDPVLTTAAAVRERHSTLGIRLSRRLMPHLSAEFGVDAVWIAELH